MTNLYYIENCGCDDTTKGLTRMTENEFSFFKNIVENLNKNSSYRCMPTIEVYKIPDSLIRLATKEDDKDCIVFLDNTEYVLTESLYSYKYYDDLGFVNVFTEGVEKVI